MPPEGMEYPKDNHEAYMFEGKDLVYIESLIEALSLYKKLNYKNLPREIQIREDRMAMYKRLMHSLEDWMGMCLYGDFIQKFRENADMDARQFVYKCLIHREEE